MREPTVVYTSSHNNTVNSSAVKTSSLGLKEFKVRPADPDVDKISCVRLNKVCVCMSPSA